MGAGHSQYEYQPATPEDLPKYVKQPGQEHFWTADGNALQPIMMAEKGLAALPPVTVLDVFKEAVRKYGDWTALRVEEEPFPTRKNPETGREEEIIGEFKTWTWAEYYRDCETAARAFIKIGLRPGQAINILGFNSPEWVTANMGAIMAGGKAAGIYSTSTPDACKYIAEHSEAVVVVVEDPQQLQKFLEVRDELPELKALVMWKGEVPEGASLPDKPVYSWEQLMELGRYTPKPTPPPLAAIPPVPAPAEAEAAKPAEAEAEKPAEAEAEDAAKPVEAETVAEAEKPTEDAAKPAEAEDEKPAETEAEKPAEEASSDSAAAPVEEKKAEEEEEEDPMAEVHQELLRRMEAQKPGHCCTLIYTSGTTGVPKAVMISHDNITWTVRSFFSTLPPNPRPEEGEALISYLPLSHIAAQMIDIHAPMGMCVADMPCTVTFARPTALKGSLPLTLAATRPTFFFGVPRVWEKIQERMVEIGRKTKGFSKVVAGWAKNKGAAAYHSGSVEGNKKKPWMFGLANTLVFKKVKNRLGLDRSRYNLVAAAPIKKATVEFFGSLDIKILELYGMSECTGPQNSCRHDYYAVGSCGVPIPGSEVKIDHVEGRDDPGQGEICYRGRHIMMGYMKEPEKTAEAIDDEGWLHSEDVGRIDERGMLWITGRLKDLIIGAGGENIPPVPVQDSMLLAMPFLSNVVMLGDKQKYNVALATAHLKQKEDGSFTNELVGLSKELDPECKTIEEAQKSEIWKEAIAEGLMAANNNKDLVKSNAWKCQKVYLLPTDFSVTEGHLTATLKVKRNVVEKMFQAEIDAMYAGTEGIQAKRTGLSVSSRPATSQAGEEDEKKSEDAAAPAEDVAAAADAAAAVPEAPVTDPKPVDPVQEDSPAADAPVAPAQEVKPEPVEEAKPEAQAAAPAQEEQQPAEAEPVAEEAQPAEAEPEQPAEAAPAQEEAKPAAEEEKPEAAPAQEEEKPAAEEEKPEAAAQEEEKPAAEDAPAQAEEQAAAEENQPAAE